MPSTLNSFFRPGSRRSSAVSTSEEASAIREAQIKPPVAAPALPTTNAIAYASSTSSIPSLADSSTTDTSASLDSSAHVFPPRSQHSLPPQALKISLSTGKLASKSSSLPSIEIVSPSSNTPRSLWNPGEDSDHNSNASPPLGAIAHATDQRFGSFSPHSQSSAVFAQQSHASEVEEDDDPLFSIATPKLTSKSVAHSTPQSSRTMAKPASASKLSSTVKRSKDVPDRHDIMRKAMADATATEAFGGVAGAPNEARDNGPTSASGPQTANSTGADTQQQAQQQSARRAASAGGREGLPPQTLSGINAESPARHEKPGEGTLTFDDFAGSTSAASEGEMVLADGSIVPKDKGEPSATTTGAGGTAEAKDKKGSRMFPSRPKLGSRNNSFQSDSGELHGNPVESPTQSLVDLGSGTHSATTSPVKSKTPGHGRYATTGMVAEPIRSKQTSLAIPGSNGTLEVSGSTSPLQRLRKLSDVSLNSKKAAPSGGIAGALAASGMAGMGVGHAELVQRAQARLAEPKPSSGSQGKKQSRSRTSSVGSAYAPGYEGGMYRDPVTGAMIERGPDHAALVAAQAVAEARRPAMPHSRSGTMNSSVSCSGSDVSAASGLNAAADFALGLDDAHGMLMPEDPLQSAADNRQSPLTPSGIGAVGGLSPSGLGERVALDDDDGWQANDMGAQITGFAVASSKRNADFHSQFPAVPEDDYLIEDYGCALVREILIQGRLYVSENHVCFYANIFGWVTNIVLPFSEIVSVEKRMTAYVIPNAIQIATLHAKSTFASFLSRDTTYDLIVNIWKLSHPSLRPADTYEAVSEDESVDGATGDGGTVMGQADSAGMDKAGKLEADQATSTPSKKSKRKLLKKKLGMKEGAGGQGSLMVNGQNAADGGGAAAAAAIARGKSPGPGGAKREPHRKTTCNCGEKDNKHFPTVALDTVYPAVPEKLYNLIFTSGFMKNFWTDNQKLMDLQMSDWAPKAQQGGNMLSRDISYIKPLSGGFGPKQAKCLLTDENVHVDFDEFVTTLTTTRTPEVPSGGSFAVKTKVCITWNGGNMSRILVTCQVDWSARSMLRSVIDRASIDGQKQYYKDLDQAIRSYIKEHASEFREEGDDREAAEEAVAEHVDANEKTGAGGEGAAGGAATSSGATGTDEEKTGLAKYMDQMQPVFDIVGGAIGGLLELSPKMLILGAVVVLLVISNLWALSSGSERDPLDPHRLRATPAASRSSSRSSGSSRHLHGLESSAEAVAVAVRDVLRDYFEPHGGGAAQHRFLGRSGVEPTASASPKLAFDGEVTDPVYEIQSLLGLLDDVEARVMKLRSHLQHMDKKQESG